MRVVNYVNSYVRLLMLILVIGPISPAMAGDCWVKTRENAQTGTGGDIKDSRFAKLRTTMLSAEKLLRADEAINQIPKVRYQLHHYIGQAIYEGLLSSSSYIFLHDDRAWQENCELGAGADITHFASLEFKINDLGSLTSQSGFYNQNGEMQFITQPEQTDTRGGYPVYEDRVLVITPSGSQAFVPVTLGEYLDWWHAQLLGEQGEVQKNASEMSADNEEWLEYIETLQQTDPDQARELTDLMKEMNGAAALSGEANDEWRELQRLRQNLTAAELSRAVYLNGEDDQTYRFNYSLEADDLSKALVKVNPKLWVNVKDETEVRLITLEIYVNGRANFESDENGGPSIANLWLKNVDPHPYAALME